MHTTDQECTYFLHLNKPKFYVRQTTHICITDLECVFPLFSFPSLCRDAEYLSGAYKSLIWHLAINFISGECIIYICSLYGFS